MFTLYFISKQIIVTYKCTQIFIIRNHVAKRSIVIFNFNLISMYFVSFISHNCFI